MQLVLERENPQPGGGITGLSYAGAAGEAVLGEGLINHAKISKMLFGRVRVFCGLTPELSQARFAALAMVRS